MRFLLYSFLIFGIVSCGGNSKDSQDAVAKVGDNYLYQQDLEGQVPAGLSEEENERAVNEVINKWIERQVYLEEAKASLSDADMREISAQLTEFENSLIVHHYKKKVLRNELDTQITEDKILEAYEQNKENFKLKTDIYQVYFMKIPTKYSSNFGEVRKQMRGYGRDFTTELQSYALKYATVHSVDDIKWFSENELQALLPPGYLDQNKLWKGKFVEHQERSFTYFLKVHEIKVEQNVAPLEFVRERLEEIILRKRGLSLVKAKEKEIFLNASSAGDFERFEDKTVQQ